MRSPTQLSKARKGYSGVTCGGIFLLVLLFRASFAFAYRVSFVRKNSPATKLTIEVADGESILDAIERENHSQNVGKLPEQKQCTRGSCLTCACRISSSSQSNSYKEQGRNDLPNNAKLQNYILPCNSIPVNNNLLIEWDDDGTIQDDLWSLVYQKRFEGDSLRLGQNAAAREISRWAEKQKDDWV
eukprot:CAMPEP_0118636986 /NCGR_PEP_ID=MMETSP0785-20121206/2917_1 /TAXON_ID=91992 /ORGANISM="Bolidomonas pacifica, Strain CCMP 1866" /LENGTH=185 /DNA_ID=CAMNT_0006528153 /DNA_START=264 /DNA_END=818 /DNA_ORIENTATION=-